MNNPKRKRNMSGYDAAVRALAGMNQDMVNLRNLIRPPSLDVYFRVDQVLEQLRLDHINVRQALLPPLAISAAPYKDILTATNHLHDVLAKTSVSMGTVDMVHESWREQIRSLTNFSDELAAAAKVSLGENSLQLAATETILAGIDFDFLKSQFDLPLSSISAMEQSLFDTTSSYRTLIESVPDLSGLVQMPSFVLPGATYNLYTAGHALRALGLADEDRDEEIEEEFAIVSAEYAGNLDIVELLESVHPELVTLYLGAKEALYGNNPDRKRHALISLRELWNNVVRAIAPNGQVSEWIAEHGKSGDLDCNDRPTRRGKINYLSRNINSPPLVDFVDQIATMSTKLHKLYGRVHQLEPGLSDDQLLPILWWTESQLINLIRIWLTTAQS